MREKVKGKMLLKTNVMTNPTTGKTSTKKNLSLTVALLPSINRKDALGINRRTGKLVKYAKPDYAAKQDAVIWQVRDAVNADGWVVSGTDRYKLTVEVYFVSELRSDLDGPLKATLDCLQRGGAIWNDNRVMALTLEKLIDAGKPRCEVLVEKI